MTGPPDEVLTAVLEGGPLDGIEFEIGPGQETMELSPLRIEGMAERRELSGSWVYRYAGVVDAGGRAVFVKAQQ